MNSQEARTIPQGDRALTFREANARYGIPEHRLRQCRSERALDFFKIGRAVFVSEQSLIKFLERHREFAVSAAGGAL